MYRIAVTPGDVGARVSVRRVLTDGREGLGDVVGELLSWTGGVLAVRRRDGSVEQIPERTLVSAKIVP